MKNLKQVLALGMAFSLTMSAMAGAAFTDQDSINKENADAVQLLSALDIIKGYDDGSFNPTKPVTRAEMAKMIYTIRNGGNANADAYKSVSTSFTDIQGHWAEGYIKYLQSTEIIAGKSATIFDPDSTVTTVEAMKMALVLGGYNAEKAGIYGAQWANKTISLATTNGLTKNVYSAMDGGCTRQDAAQILANALDMNAVQWSEITQSFLNDSDTGLALGGEPISVGEKWMDLKTEVGFLTEVPSAQQNPKGIAFVYDSDRDGDIDSTDKTVTFKNVTTDVSDLMGYEVKVVWDEEDVTSSDAVYGIYKTGNNTSYETTWKNISDQNGKVKFDGKTYQLDNGTSGRVTVYADKDWSAATATSKSSSFFDGSNLSDTVTFIDNDNDGKFEAAQVRTKTATKVTYVGPSSITTDTLVNKQQDIYGIADYDTTPELNEVNTYEGIASGDYVTVSYDVYSDKVTYEKAEVVTGNVEATRTENGTLQVKLNGTWMKATKGYENNLKSASLSTGDSVEYVAIDDLIYHIKKTDGTYGSNSIGMIYNTADGVSGTLDHGKVFASIIKRDGTKEDVRVTKLDGVDVTAASSLNGIVGDTITFRIVNGSYEIKTISDSDNGFGTVMNTGGFDHADQASGAYRAVGTSDKQYDGKDIADSAVVFVYDNIKKDAKVLTGAELKRSTIATSFATTGVGSTDPYMYSKDNNGFTYVYCMSVQVGNMDTNLNAVGGTYGYLLSDAYETTTADGKQVRVFDLWTNAGAVTAYETTGDTYTYKSGTVITYEVTSTKDGITYIKNVKDEAAKVQLGKVEAINDAKTLVALDGVNYELVNDSVVVNVNTDKNKGISNGTDARNQITVADLSDAGEANVRYIVSSSTNEVIFMLIDSENNEIVTGNNLYNASASALRGAILGAQDEYKKTGKVQTVTVDGVVPANSFTVPTGVELVFASGADIKGNTTIDGDAKFAGAIDIDASMTLTINGDVNATNVTVNGAGHMTVDGVVNGSVTVNTTGTVTVNGNVITRATATTAVTGTLTVNKGTTNVTGGVNKVVVKDNAATVSVTGNVDTVEIDAAVTVNQTTITGNVTNLKNDSDVAITITGDVTNPDLGSGDATYSADKDTFATKVTL